MKTKKISWQAIAIVVLALVLIASIALGVSGAWFQDSDKEETSATLGKAVTIRLADTTENDNRPATWKTEYADTTSAYPGDLIFGATSIIPGEAYDTNKVSAAIYRIKIVASATGDGYVANQSEADATDPAKNDSYLINQMLAQATDETFKLNWTEGNTADDNGNKWYYYNQVNQSSTKIDIFSALKLSNEISNAAAEWKISVSIEVEAIQAANISENTDWYNDMPGSENAGLKQAVIEYNNGRLAPSGN